VSWGAFFFFGWFFFFVFWAGVLGFFFFFFFIVSLACFFFLFLGGAGLKLGGEVGAGFFGHRLGAYCVVGGAALWGFGCSACGVCGCCLGGRA